MDRFQGGEALRVLRALPAAAPWRGRRPPAGAWTLRPNNCPSSRLLYRGATSHLPHCFRAFSFWTRDTSRPQQGPGAFSSTSDWPSSAWLTCDKQNF